MLKLSQVVDLLLAWVGMAKVTADAEVYVLVDGCYYGVDKITLTPQIGHELGKPAIVIEASQIIL